MTKLLAVALLLIAPALALAGPASYFDQPDTTYATNTVIDIIEHHGGIWFATGEGLNFSFDGGQTWLLYNKTNGLPNNDVSAIYSDGARIWVATNHSATLSGSEISVSDTLVFSGDDGQTWTRVNFGAAPTPVPYAVGEFKTIYDITGAQGNIGHDWIFLAGFAAGLLGSADGGLTWQRVYINRSDSIQFYRAYLPASQKNPGDTLLLRQRYFSCKADTSHQDSLFLWAGTAGGVLQYIFTTPENKFYTYGIQKIAYCQSCLEQNMRGDSLFMFIGGKNGVTRGLVTGGPYITRFTSDGLPGPMVTALFESHGVLFVGTADSTTGSSTGLAVSQDYGESFTPGTADAFGPNNQILDFAEVGNRVYMAAQQSGLRTPCTLCSDTLTAGWDRIYLDSSSMTAANGWNTVWSLASLGDTLFVGTDSGLAILFMSPTSTSSIDSMRLVRIANDAASSSRVAQVRLQLFGVDTTGAADSFHVWTINRPISSGTPAIGRSRDRGVTWEFYESGAVNRQLAIAGDTVFVVDTSEVKLADTKLDTVSFNKADVRVGTDTLTQPNTVEALGRFVSVGAERTLAMSVNQGNTWGLHRPNFNPLTPDIVGLYTDSTTLNLDTSGVYIYGLTGNFIPALGLRYLPGDKPAQVLASCRPTTSGSDGISIGTEVPITVITVDTNSSGDTVSTTTDTVGYGYKWQRIYANNFAWNFDTHGPDTIYVASDNGLLIVTGAGTSSQAIDSIRFKNAAGVSLLTPGTPIYAVKQSGGDLWAGTGDGTVRVSLSDLTNQDLFFKTDPGEEIYAYPVPFSPNRGDQARFHFPVHVAGAVTLQIYDFAMNLVATPVDNRFFEVGVYPPGPLAGERVSWDGLNDRGDLAAVGMYYIKITYSDGSIKWGKLAIVP